MFDVDSFLKSYSSVSSVARRCIGNREYCEAVLNELKAIIDNKDKINAQLREMLQDKIEQIEKLEKQVREKNKQIEKLHYQTMGISATEGRIMKSEYERGVSLRELAKLFNCDKSTVKRRLIKMGVTIRNKGGDDNTPPNTNK